MCIFSFKLLLILAGHYFEVLLCLSVQLASGFINEFIFFLPPCQGIYLRVGEFRSDLAAQTITVSELTKAVGGGNCFESYPESLTGFKHNWIRPRLCSRHIYSLTF